MGLYQSDHPDVPGMKGIHLFHFVASNCSQRVRIALEEKGLPWTSHHVDILGHQHLTADYQRINPNGVVPTLVHDGQVVLESNDILRYLDQRFPEPALAPQDDDARGEMEALVDLASGFQPTIKTLSHQLVFKAFRKVSAEEVERFETEHNDKSLAAFLRDYSEDGEAWQTRVALAHSELTKVFGLLEERLADRPWLSGADHGLADISWVVNVNRLQQARIDFTLWPQLADWVARAMSRPAFDRAVTSYTP